jgi:hypothetical protein
METNSYNRIKEFVFRNLKNKTTQLADGQITEEIANAKKLIESLGLVTFAHILPDKEPLEKLPEEDWERMERELEKHFDVKMKNGILIQGEEQQKRDTTWWSSKEKIQGETYYWERYKTYIAGFLPPEVVSAMDEDTDRVMNNIGNPKLKEFYHKGMVVGHVQSGKTGNYAGLVCKAADSGYKFIVVITGGTNNLRNQTQQRLNESFVGKDKGNQVGAGIGNATLELLPICLTTTERDFNKQDADKNSQSMNFDNSSNTPILIVIKKHPSSLSNVIKWLRNQYKNKINHAMLIIDDESDYASINYKDKDDPTAINKRIRELLTLFSKGSYVAYTATPYANIFIDHEATNVEYGNDLFPKDFIYALDAPSNYFSARKIFLDTDNKYLIPIDDYSQGLPLDHKIHWQIPSLPESLHEAIRLFIINIAIRKLRGQENQHNSMLIHVSRFTSIHQQTAIVVDKYITEIKKDLNSFGKLPDAIRHSTHIKDIKKTFDSILEVKSPKENWKNVVESISDSINTIIIREVHQKTKIALEYRNDIATNAIVIGGASLSRGFTLEGLSVSYFLRTTVFYDTLMQMGRWFGYRTGYEDLCRIYMPKTLMKNFAHIIEVTEELIFNLKKMEEAKRTPNDFGLVIREHPESLLQITARNKQKGIKTYVSTMNLNGYLKETVRLTKDSEIRIKNRVAIEHIVRELVKNYKKSDVGNHYLWTEIDKKYISEFLKEFQTYQTDSLGAKNLMPIRHIQEYVNTINTNWDVALYSGTSSNENYNFTETPIKAAIRREFDDFGNYIQVGQRKISSGNPEEIVLSDEIKAEIKNKEFEKKGDKTDYTRSKMKNPLLMLHVLDLVGFDDKLAAFGVCFPNNGLSSNQTVAYKVNTVFESGLDDILADEEDYDDYQ